MSMGWTWPWDAAANSYRANRYAKAREDTERRYMEATSWGVGVVSDIQGLWYNLTSIPATGFSALTGVYWNPDAEEHADIPGDLEDKALEEGYQSREKLDREIADLEADRIMYYLSLRWPSAWRTTEAIRHAKEKMPIELPGEVAGDESSPLRTPALIAGALGAAGAAYYFNDAVSAPSTPLSGGGKTEIDL